MLDTSAIRKEMHEARLVDSFVANVARKWMNKLCDELDEIRNDFRLDLCPQCLGRRVIYEGTHDVQNCPTCNASPRPSVCETCGGTKDNELVCGDCAYLRITPPLHCPSCGFVDCVCEPLEDDEDEGIVSVPEDLWTDSKERRRQQLIEAKMRDEPSPAAVAELAQLQEEFGRHQDANHPLPELDSEGRTKRVSVSQRERCPVCGRPEDSGQVCGPCAVKSMDAMARDDFNGQLSGESIE